MRSVSEIIQYGIPRSGTTVLWQALDHLFGNQAKVRKSHAFVPYAPGRVVVIACRDPRETLCSWLRMKYRVSTPEKVRMNDLVWICKQPLRRGRSFLERYKRKYGPHNALLMMRYENYFESFEYMCDAFSIFFETEIDEDSRAAIKDKFNVQSNKKIADKVGKHFRKERFDKTSKIHGGHVGRHPINGWKHVIPKRMMPRVKSMLRRDMVVWGYA